MERARDTFFCQGEIYLQAKELGHVGDHLPPCIAEVKISGDMPSVLLQLLGRVLDS
jgi:hypothetical protein